MHPYPHVYKVAAVGAPSGPVPISAVGLPSIDTAPPAEFDGPGDLWSPETMLVAAVADCFVLTFRAISRLARIDWRNLQCSVEGVLERVEGVTRFTRFTTRATLSVPPGTDAEKCRRLLEKAEHSCLVANSLNGQRVLEANVAVEP